MRSIDDGEPDEGHSDPETARAAVAAAIAGREAWRVSLVVGSIALAVSALAGMILTVGLNGWVAGFSGTLVPAVLGIAAIATGPRRSAGRQLGIIALLVLAAGLAAGLIVHATTGPFGD